MFKFKEPAVFFPGQKERGIDYAALDPAWDQQTNPIFKRTKLIEENGNDFIIGNYTGLLPLTPFVEPAPDVIVAIDNIVFSGAGFDEIQPDGRVDLLANTLITITFDVALPNGTKLTVPIRNRDTKQLKVIKANVSNLSVSKSFKIVPSGFWFIDADEVNNMGREGVTFAMDEIIILVQDA